MIGTLLSPKPEGQDLAGGNPKAGEKFA